MRAYNKSSYPKISIIVIFLKRSWINIWRYILEAVALKSATRSY